MAQNKEVQRKVFLRWYAANREQALENMKVWRVSVPGFRHRFQRTLKRVGITAEDYAHAWVSQSAMCAGCLDLLDDGPNTHIDHCHATGAFRGLLCSGCNLAIGKLGDCPDTLMRLAAYLRGANRG